MLSLLRSWMPLNWKPEHLGGSLSVVMATEGDLRNHCGGFSRTGSISILQVNFSEQPFYELGEEGATTPVVQQCKQIPESSPEYAHAENGLVMRVCRL
jgi:hypothetical protein